MPPAPISLVDRAGLDRPRLARIVARGLEGADDGELFLEYRQAEALTRARRPDLWAAAKARQKRPKNTTDGGQAAGHDVYERQIRAPSIIRQSGIRSSRRRVLRNMRCRINDYPRSPLPPQHQARPGSEAQMRPRPQGVPANPRPAPAVVE